MQDLAPIAIASGASGFLAIGAPSKDVAAALSRKACGCGCAFASASLRMSVRGNIRLKSWVVSALAGNGAACGLPSFMFAAACAVIVGNMRLKSCSVSALEETAGWATCAAACRATSSAPTTTNRLSSATTGCRPTLRTGRSDEAMIDIHGMAVSREIPAHLRHGVVRMQAFLVFDAYVECRDVIIGVERAPDATGRVLAEHRVFGVGLRECLFVLALHGRLHRGLERLLDPIDQGDQIEWCSVDETRPHLRDAALCVRRGGHAARAAQPREQLGVAQRFVHSEIRSEPLLDKLARQRGGRRAGRG